MTIWHLVPPPHECKIVSAKECGKGTIYQCDTGLCGAFYIRVTGGWKAISEKSAIRKLKSREPA